LPGLKEFKSLELPGVKKSKSKSIDVTKPEIRPTWMLGLHLQPLLLQLCREPAVGQAAEKQESKVVKEPVLASESTDESFIPVEAEVALPDVETADEATIRATVPMQDLEIASAEEDISHRLQEVDQPLLVSAGLCHTSTFYSKEH
jgi:hypothetical protein